MKRFFLKHWHPELTITLIIFIITLLLAVICDYIFAISSREFIVALNGLAITFFFTMLIIYFNKVNERKALIERYHEEIDDYRDWREEEAKYRILGLVKRLQKLNNLRFDLNRCYLGKAILNDMIFERSNFNCINLTSANIDNCVFKNVNLRGVSLANATIVNCKFINCNFEGGNFFGAILYNVDFLGSNIKDFNSKNNLHLARVIYNPMNLSESLFQEIKAKRPDLLEKPTFEKSNRWTDQFVKN